VSIYVNHLGFVPGAAKRFLVGGQTSLPFVVRDEQTGAVTCEGVLRQAPSDFGVYAHGDLILNGRPGLYRIDVGRERSEPFAVRANVYEQALQQMASYFTLQRCGDTDRNWLGRPCHLDDGMRGDTREHRDVSGGWHDACDLCEYWTPMVAFAMWLMAEVQRG
jgi:endoglucanase